MSTTAYVVMKGLMFLNVDGGFSDNIFKAQTISNYQDAMDTAQDGETVHLISIRMEVIAEVN